MPLAEMSVAAAGLFNRLDVWHTSLLKLEAVHFMRTNTQAAVYALMDVVSS